MKLIPVFFLLCSGLAWSQAAEPPVKLRSLCFSHQQGIDKLEIGVPGTAPTGIQLPLFLSTISQPLDVLPAKGSMYFCQRDKNAAGQEVLKLVTEARSLGVKRQLAIFLPSKDAAKPYSVHVIDDSEKEFPMGTSLAINLSAKPFHYMIGEHKTRVEPGKTVRIPMAKETNDRGQVSVIVGVELDGKVVPVNQTRWFTGEDKRDIIISFVHPVTGQPTVNCYQDRPPWLLPQPAPGQ